MQTRKVVISTMRRRAAGIIPMAALAASLGMLALGGCSEESAQVPPEKPVPVNFALDKCEQIEPNLYKCPAVDQAICTPQFIRTDVNCVRIGPKGSVFVQRGGAGGP